LSESNLVCWRCGAGLAGLALPMSRYAVCRACNSPLHVCKLCEFYEPKWRSGCREDRAEDVRDRERANFCDYFKPRPNAYVGSGDEASRAREQLDALFGLGKKDKN
jgi:hypothetical protein